MRQAYGYRLKSNRRNENRGADGLTTSIVLTKTVKKQNNPLKQDCRDLESGRIGKCCRDPFYTDPWPTNQLGKWVPGVFGGNDGKYSPDNRGSGSSARAQVTGRPPVTGSTLLNNFRLVFRWEASETIWRISVLKTVKFF